jgi:hypothetical protein
MVRYGVASPFMLSLPLAIFEHSGSALPGSAPAIMVAGSSITLDTHAFAIPSSAAQRPGTIQVVTASARVPGSTAFEAGPCEPAMEGTPATPR